MRLLEIADDVPVTDVQIGVATGRLRSGTYGHAERRTFCCLGDAVNLAARLMTGAPAGGIWVHGEVASHTEGRFDWVELPPTRVKGRARPVPVSSLLGRATRHGPAAASGPSHAIIGRETELTRLRSLWQRAANGEGQVVVVQAEAGTGKTRLVRELTDGLAASGVPVVAGEATPLATQAAYTAWRDVWQDLLGLSSESDEAAVAQAVAGLDPALVARAPLLGPVLGLALRDSDLTVAFDGELRKTSLEDLLARLLTSYAAARPLVVVLEEAMWLDPLSRDLLEVLARTVRTLPVLLVALLRPDGTALAGLPVRGGHVTDVVLGSLDADASRALVQARHRELVGRDPDLGLVDTVVARAEGNPFYLEQLVEYVLAHAAGAEDATEVLELPASLHSLVLSRIDAQAEGSRRAVKVASVIGRAFHTPLVATAYPDLGVEEAVHRDLLGAATTRLIDLEDPAERAFAFGHAVTRDVAYDSLPFSTRSVLHGRVGDALESEPDGPRRHLDLLAYHYSRSDDLPKKRQYLRQAAAAARAAYAQETAISYLEQLLPIVDADERPEVLLQLAEELEIDGDWAAAEDAVARARAAAEEVGDAAGLARSRVARASWPASRAGTPRPRASCPPPRPRSSRSANVAGRARVLHLRGTLESQQGHPERARAAYDESLALRRDLGDEAGVAAMLTNLALVAEDEGDLDEAERLGREGLARRRALDDRRAVSVSLTNMGMLATARGDLPLAHERFVEAQALAEEVGDPLGRRRRPPQPGQRQRDLGDLALAAADLRGAAGCVRRARRPLVARARLRGRRGVARCPRAGATTPRRCRCWRRPSGSARRSARPGSHPPRRRSPRRSRPRATGRSRGARRAEAAGCGGRSRVRGPARHGPADRLRSRPTPGPRGPFA